MKNPILVTGVHRSGTTWIGKMLAASPEVTYISEPLNVYHRLGVLSTPTKYWYMYICEENQDIFLAAFRDTLRYRYHYGLEIKSLRSMRDLGRMFRDIGRFTDGRLKNLIPLLKDPFAIFSVPWFATKLNCQIVIAVRHPLAFVSSLKRLDWVFDFRDLLAQPLLMRDYLEPFRKDMINCSGDVVVQGSLLWRIVYTVVNELREKHSEFHVVRHEDLSLCPEDGFRDLYISLGLAFSRKIQKTLFKFSQGSNPNELSADQVHAIKLDSQANLSNWRKRLSAEDIRQIQHLTSDIASEFYSDDSWE